MSQKAREFFENFKAPDWFKVEDGFPIARGKSVLVKREDRSESEVFSKAGIIIPQTSRMNRFVGRVYAVGPEVSWLPIGCRVIYNSMADQSILYKGVDYTTLYDLDVYYIIPEDASTMEARKEREGRRQYSADELPDSKPSKEVLQEQKENADEGAEKIQREAKKRSILVNGTGEAKSNSSPGNTDPS